MAATDSDGSVRGSTVFLSYRRRDTAGHAGRLVDHVRSAFPGVSVFMDVDTLQPGVNFLEAIEECVAACDLVLALIGDEWLTLTDSGETAGWIIPTTSSVWN